jgi:hypothetical protein
MITTISIVIFLFILSHILSKTKQPIFFETDRSYFRIEFEDYVYVSKLGNFKWHNKPIENINTSILYYKDRPILGFSPFIYTDMYKEKHSFFNLIFLYNNNLYICNINIIIWLV